METLPDKCLEKIFGKLGFFQKIALERVCKRWKDILHTCYKASTGIKMDDEVFKTLNLYKNKKKINEILQEVLKRLGSTLDCVIIEESFLSPPIEEIDFLSGKPDVYKTDLSLSQFIRDLSMYCNNIENLSITKQKNTIECAKVTDEELSLLFLNNKKISTVEFDELTINGKCLSNLPFDSVEKIVLLSCNKLDPIYIKDSFLHFKKLNDIIISHCKIAKILIKVLSLNNDLNIEHFDLCDERDIDYNKELTELFSKQKKLKSVSLKISGVSKDCLSSLPYATIESLNFTRNMNIAIKSVDTVLVFPNFVNLNDLRISIHQMTDQIAKAICSCKNLRKLSFRNTIYSSLTTSGEKYFSNLTNLEEYRVSIGEFTTDGVLEALSKCNQLRSVDLLMCMHVTDEGIKSLASLPNFKDLELNQFSDISDKPLGLFKNLEKLVITGSSNVENMGLCEMIKNSPDLILLKVASCENVTNEIIDAAIKMKKVSTNKNLLQIFVRGSGVNVEDLIDIPANIKIIDSNGFFNF